MMDLMLDPATTEFIWTLTITGLLMEAGSLTIWLMPWSDAEILAVHQTVKSHLPTPLTTTAITAATREPHSRRPLASA